MAVDTQTVEKLAELAQIAIAETAIDEVSRQLGAVLQLVDQLQAVNTEYVQTMAHPLGTKQRLRADRVLQSNQRKRLLAPAPLTEEGLFLVPKVID